MFRLIAKVVMPLLGTSRAVGSAYLTTNIIPFQFWKFTTLYCIGQHLMSFMLFGISLSVSVYYFFWSPRSVVCFSNKFSTFRLAILSNRSSVYFSAMLSRQVLQCLSDAFFPIFQIPLSVFLFDAQFTMANMPITFFSTLVKFAIGLPFTTFSTYLSIFRHWIRLLSISILYQDCKIVKPGVPHA